MCVFVSAYMWVRACEDVSVLSLLYVFVFGGGYTLLRVRPSVCAYAYGHSNELAANKTFWQLGHVLHHHDLQL